MVADPNETAWQHMAEITPQEFHYGAGFGLAVTGVEGDGAVTDAQQAVVADADAMRVAPEIAQHVLGVAEGRATVDDSAATVEPVAHGRVELVAERSAELAAEQRTGDVNGEEEVRWSRKPALLVERKSAPADHAVQVRMPVQLAAPGVKHGGDPELGAEPVGVPTQLEQGAGSCPEQQVVDELGMAASEVA